MQIANRLAGYSLGDADILAPRDGQEKSRRDGCAARKIPGRLRRAERFLRKRPKRFSI
jgi:hypothetical protein